MGLFSKSKSTTVTKESRTSTTQVPRSSGNDLASASAASRPTTAALPSIPPPALIDPSTNPIGYLRSLPAIRARAEQVYERKSSLKHLSYNEGNMKELVRFVVSIIQRDYGNDYGSIPPHGRWQHFEVGGRNRIDELIKGFQGINTAEVAKRLVDLFLVSVLLDAGTGTKWAYKASNGKLYRRSEGLALASLELFQTGFFSSSLTNKFQVDGSALSAITLEGLRQALQVKDSNPLAGLEGRRTLLNSLGTALSANSTLFGSDHRPGSLVDYLLAHPSANKSGTTTTVSVTTLWSALIDGLASIWPSDRTNLEGVSLGDAWPYSSLPKTPAHASIIPFHKLTQWLTYSLTYPLQKVLNINFAHMDLLTGLPEYRNGGLFIDLGVLTLKTADADRGRETFLSNSKIPGQQTSEVVPTFDASDDVIVEWRAMTICLLDRVRTEINKTLKLNGTQALSLAQVLEAGTWKAGREIAEVQRPNTRGSPIAILSDGTIF